MAYYEIVSEKEGKNKFTVLSKEVKVIGILMSSPLGTA
jgi:hypothetical protein